jgi:hypothetical protein
MLSKRGLIFIILFSAFCLSQETKPEATAKNTASISGTVSQADTHVPIRNVQLNFWLPAEDDEAAPSSDRQFVTKTDEKGHFEIRDLAPETYYIQATRAGMVLQESNWEPGRRVTLEAGKNQIVNLTMLPSAVITGQVMNEENEPIPSVSVTAMRYGYTILGRHLHTAASGNTDDKGQFRIFGLPPGSYLVVATPGGGFGTGMIVATNSSSSAASQKTNSAIYTTTFYPNETAAERATPVLLKPGDEMQVNFNLTRVPTHSISGTVTDLSAAKPADEDNPERVYSIVTVMREGTPMPAGMAIIGKDSSFKVPSLPAGRYKLVAVQTGNEHGNIGTAEVVIDSSDVKGVVIATDSSRRTVTGVVRTEGDAKLDFRKLNVVFSPVADPNKLDMAEGNFFGSPGRYAHVKQDGTFKVEILPSPKPYDVILTGGAGGMEDWFTSKILVGGKDVMQTGFKPDESQAPVEIVISNKGSLIEGTVLDREQKPFPGAEVFAFPTDPKLRRGINMLQAGTADQQGRFKLRGVRPGEYIIFALENSQAQPFTTEPFLKANSGKIQTVKLEGGEKQQLQLQVIREQEK